MELVQNDIIIESNSLEDATEGLITFTPKGFKIVVDELRFSSFKEFIQQTTSEKHKKSSGKLQLKVSKDLVLIHLIKYLTNLFTSKFTFTNY